MPFLPPPPYLSSPPTPLTWNPLADHPPQDAHTGVMVHVQKRHLIVFLAKNEEKLWGIKKKQSAKLRYKLDFISES